MNTPASIAGHPIHPMLVPIAIGGFVLSFAFDVVRLATGSADPWSLVAYYVMIGGIVGALLAALPGLVDLLSISAAYTRKIALIHMAINLTVVALFVVNTLLRHGNPPDLRLPTLLSVAGLLLLLVSGWLGGKMVFEAGVGVRPGAG